MGLRWRKRTKGKDGWLNFSYSDKNGLNWSASAKSGPFTWNSGNGKTTRRRITTNLPGGFYHVTSDKGVDSDQTNIPPDKEGVSNFVVYSALVAVLLIIIMAIEYPILTSLGVAIIAIIRIIGKDDIK